MNMFRRKRSLPHDAPVVMTHTQAAAIAADFGRHLEQDAPLIKDASSLPHPKSQIMTALNACEKACQSMLSSPSLSDEKRIAIRTSMESVRSSRIWLCEYADIDEADRSTVEYLNRFRTHRDIPAGRKDDFYTLEHKYSLQGIESARLD